MTARIAMVVILLAGDVFADDDKKHEPIEVKVQPPKVTVKPAAPAKTAASAKQSAPAKTITTVPAKAAAPVKVAAQKAAAPALHDGPLNIARICRDLIAKDLGEQEWEKFIAKATLRYKDFEKEYDIASVKRFLDDKLITLAPRLTSGNGPVLKEFCCWLALYDFYVEPVPGYIQSISETDKQWIVGILSDFDWNRAAEQIKEKAKGQE